MSCLSEISEKVLWRLSYLCRKLRINGLVYKAFSRHCCAAFDSSKVIPLREFWSDNGKSSLCSNVVVPEPSYDLQIVVPAYNVGKYVEACLNSIISQETKYKVKLIIVNDGSTDNTYEVINKYRSLPDVEIINQENRGLSGARNSGMKTIDARYVMFVDSDDELCPGAVECLLDRAFEIDTDIVEGGYERFDDSGIISVHHMSDSLNNRGINGFAWGKVYKARLFSTICFPEGYWYEDTIGYQIVYPSASLISTVGQIVYRWRRNSESITSVSKGNLRSIETFWVMNKVLEDRAALGIPMDQESLDLLMYQVRTNYNRVSLLFDSRINKSLFYQTCELFDTYCSLLSYEKIANRDLAVALTERNYKLYRAFCMFR